MSSFNLAAGAGIALISVLGFCSCADAYTSPEIERITMAQSAEYRAALTQERFTRVVRALLQALNSGTVEPHDSAWVVSGRVMFGGEWHIIATSPARFEQSRQAFNGLHATFSTTPHQLSLVSLSNCATIETFMVPDDSQKQRR